MPTSALAHALRNPAASQADVLYIRSEARKLLERLDQKAQYRELLFFCDWTVHAKLTYKRVVGPVIEEFSACFREFAKAGPLGALTKPLRDIVSLNRLRSELRRLFSAHGLPTNQVDNNGEWAAFVVLYASIVQQCPLQLQDGFELTLASLKLRPELKRQENEETVIVTKWMLTKDDKEIGTVFNEGYMKTFTETWTLDAAGTVARSVTD